MSPSRDDIAAARDLLNSSERLRADLLSAVAKLDSYIEQLKAITPNRPGASDEPPPTS